MDEDFLKAMWRESCARDGFLVQLRVDLNWDKEAFERLTEAMRLCCKHYELVSAQQLKLLHEQATVTGKELAMRMQLQGHEDALEDDLTDPPLPETKRLLPDWLAELFWFIPEEVIGWTSHEAWEKKRAREPEYFEKAYERLRLLASWFFTGSCPWLDEEKGWASTAVK
ncbi:MAG TPA: hypothetical protein VKY19_18130 [Ktedonosporobacter sp.]|jgi:hypothetical protein|nr:hypothetical protein [Ktedonosporobacter sp.]